MCILHFLKCEYLFRLYIHLVLSNKIEHFLQSASIDIPGIEACKISVSRQFEDRIKIIQIPLTSELSGAADYSSFVNMEGDKGTVLISLLLLTLQR